MKTLKTSPKMRRGIYIPGNLYKKANGKVYKCGPAGNLVALTPEEMRMLEAAKNAREASRGQEAKAQD